MVIYDSQTNTCEEYEVKHSADKVPEQTQSLMDEKLNEEVEAKYGQITEKSVIYRGESCTEGEIKYINVQEYLKEL